MRLTHCCAFIECHAVGCISDKLFLEMVCRIKSSDQERGKLVHEQKQTEFTIGDITHNSV